jgi:hypothetical protein
MSMYNTVQYSYTLQWIILFATFVNLVALGPYVNTDEKSFKTFQIIEILSIVFSLILFLYILIKVRPWSTKESTMQLKLIVGLGFILHISAIGLMLSRKELPNDASSVVKQDVEISNSYVSLNYSGHILSYVIISFSVLSVLLLPSVYKNQKLSYLY